MNTLGLFAFVPGVVYGDPVKMGALTGGFSLRRREKNHETPQTAKNGRSGRFDHHRPCSASLPSNTEPEHVKRQNLRTTVSGLPWLPPSVASDSRLDSSFSVRCSDQHGSHGSTEPHQYASHTTPGRPMFERGQT